MTHQKEDIIRIRFIEIFEEVELKLIEINKRRKNRKSMTCDSSLEEVLESIKPSNKKNKNEYINEPKPFHHSHYPKDISRNKLQTMFNTTYTERFQYF